MYEKSELIFKNKNDENKSILTQAKLKPTQNYKWADYVCL